MAVETLPNLVSLDLRGVYKLNEEGYMALVTQHPF